MNFKEKHFRQAFGPLLFSALMVLPTGCGKTNKNYEVVENNMGLLDPNPTGRVDNYGEEVKLSHVQIPVYDDDGQRLKDQWVLTYGIADTEYIPDISRTRFKSVHLNGSPERCNVMVDRNGAVLTEEGSCGLFVEGSKVLIVGNNNLDKFIGERTVKVVQDNTKPQKNKQTVSKDTTDIKPVDTDANSAVVAEADSLIQPADTAKSINISMLKADTLSLGD